MARAKSEFPGEVPATSFRARHRAPRKPSFLAACALASLLAAPSDLVRANDNSGSTPSLVEALARSIAERDRNIEAQEAAWPTRREDQLRELPPPLPVHDLQQAHRGILRDIEGGLKRLEAEGRKDPASLREALLAARDPALATLLLPVVLEAGGDDATLEPVLVTLLRRWKPCPLEVALALSKLQTREGCLAILEVGREEQSVSLLAAAGSSAEPGVIEALVALAEGPNEVEAGAAQRALVRLEPPRELRASRVKRFLRESEVRLQDADASSLAVLRANAWERCKKECAQTVRRLIPATKRPQARLSLIVYLGLFRDPSSYSFLLELYRDTRSQDERLACVSALSALGPQAGEFLASELRSQASVLPLQRSLIHAVGVARYRPAVPQLLELLEDRQWRDEASRSLERIAGISLGDEPARWTRWWRRQPDAGPAPQDPDLKV